MLYGTRRSSSVIPCASIVRLSSSQVSLPRGVMKEIFLAPPRFWPMMRDFPA